MDEDPNLSGAFDYERERWEQELATDEFYPLWIEHLEQQRKELNDGDYSF